MCKFMYYPCYPLFAVQLNIVTGFRTEIQISIYSIQTFSYITFHVIFHLILLLSCGNNFTLFNNMAENYKFIIQIFRLNIKIFLRYDF